MFSYLDGLFLGKAQKFSDWFQDLAGYTCFDLAKFFVELIILISCIMAFLLAPSAGPILIILPFVTIITRPITMERINTTRKQLRENPSLANPLVIEEIGRRINAILPLIFMTAMILIAPSREELMFILSLYCFGTAYLGSLYFRACTPKPPSKSKVRKLIEKAKEILSPAPHLATVAG